MSSLFSFRDEADNLGFGQAGFGHIFRTYDAAFFSNTLSLVYAADMYASHFKKDPLDEKAGMKYRREVLERGSGVKEAEILERFLGKEFSFDPFFDELKRGLEV
jgi:Zn-dependent oligopeptidase